MAITTIADMQIVPSKFSEYILTRTTEKSRLVRSGIMVSNPVVSQVICLFTSRLPEKMRYLARKKLVLMGLKRITRLLRF